MHGAQQHSRTTGYSGAQCNKLAELHGPRHDTYSSDKGSYRNIKGCCPVALHHMHKQGSTARCDSCTTTLYMCNSYLGTLGHKSLRTLLRSSYIHACHQKRTSEVGDRKTFFFVRPIYKRRAYEKCSHSFVFLAHWPFAGSFRLNTDILVTNLINLTVVVGVNFLINSVNYPNQDRLFDHNVLSQGLLYVCSVLIYLRVQSTGTNTTTPFKAILFSRGTCGLSLVCNMHGQWPMVALQY